MFRKSNISVQQFDRTRPQHIRVIIGQFTTTDEDWRKQDDLYLPKDSKPFRERIQGIIETAVRSTANLIVLPELSVPADCSELLRSWSANTGGIAVAGSHYHDANGVIHNRCPVCVEGEVFFTDKLTPAPAEVSPIRGRGLSEGNVLNVFKNTRIGDFAVLICSDYLNAELRRYVLSHDIDLLCVPAFQSDSLKYHTRMGIDCEESERGLYVAYANMVHKGLGDGRSAFFGTMDRLFSEKLQHKGITDLSPQQKLCDLSSNQDSIVILDVDIHTRRPLLGRTINSRPNVSIFRYGNYREEAEAAMDSSRIDCHPPVFQPAIRSDLARVILRGSLGNSEILGKPNFKRRAVLVGILALPFLIMILRHLQNPKQLGHVLSQAQLTSSNLLLVLSALLICVLSFVATMSAHKAGLDRQNKALKTLASLIIKRVKTPDLLTPVAIRGLVHGVEQHFRCPVLTDKLIAESIRAAALMLEVSVKEDVLVKHLRLLNTALRHFDADGPPLLSIAEIDRLIAFKNSQLLLCFSLCVATVVFATVYQQLGITITLLVAQLAVLSSSLQARFMWNPSHVSGTMPLSQVGGRKPRSGLQALFPFDFFLRSVISRSPWSKVFWTNLWAAFWEVPLMLRNYWRKERFAAMHEFRFDVASQLFRRLCNAQREIDIAVGNGKSQPAAVMSEHSRLSVQLWVVTGDPAFIRIAQKGRFSDEDLKGNIMQCLLP